MRGRCLSCHCFASWSLIATARWWLLRLTNRSDSLQTDLSRRASSSKPASSVSSASLSLASSAIPPRAQLGGRRPKRAHVALQVRRDLCLGGVAELGVGGPRVPGGGDGVPAPPPVVARLALERGDAAGLVGDNPRADSLLADAGLPCRVAGGAAARGRAGRMPENGADDLVALQGASAGRRRLRRGPRRHGRNGRSRNGSRGPRRRERRAERLPHRHARCLRAPRTPTPPHRRETARCGR